MDMDGVNPSTILVEVALATRTDWLAKPGLAKFAVKLWMLVNCRAQGVTQEAPVVLMVTTAPSGSERKRRLFGSIFG